jgi:small subunit ribosomal protein S1
VSRDRVEDIRQFVKEGDTVEAVIVNVDRKQRQINLSIKQKDAAEQAAIMQKEQEASAAAGTTNLGALLKAKMANKE